MRSERRLELSVGAFLAVAILLVLVMIWTLGKAQNIFGQRDIFYITVPDAAGIATGAKVTVSGVNAGTVESLLLNERNRTVRVNLSISREFEGSIRKDSVAEVLTQGVLGDKLIAITAGSPSETQLSPGTEIPAKRENSINAILGKASELATNLTALSKDLDQLVLQIKQQLSDDHLGHSLAKLDEILGKVNQGNGTVGGLVNDAEIYDDMKKLLGESNENRIVRNTVRKTIKDAEEKQQAGQAEQSNGK